ncbi:hypothetical protein H1R20_g1171, partial [Candolleomyces eurysporus]
MKRPPSTFRSLIPFTTSASVVDALLQDHLPVDSPYRVSRKPRAFSPPTHASGQTFAHRLERFDHEISNAIPWGVYKPADLLLDNGSEAMPRASIYRVKSGKLAPSVTEGLAMYTAAYRFHDVLVRLRGSAGSESLPRPLKHKKQDNWVGKASQWAVGALATPMLSGLNDVVQNLAALSDLHQALQTFTNEGQTAAKFLQTSPGALSDSGRQTDASVRLADEIAAVKKGKKVLIVVRNLAYVAFCISVMNKGYLQVPDHVHELGFDQQTMALKSMEPLMKKAKRIRQAMQQTAVISPLLALVSEDLTDPPLCPEELLLNMKFLGNDTPPMIRALEDVVWDAILGMVEGRHTSIAAYFHIQGVVKEFLAETRLDATDNHFFARSRCPSIPLSLKTRYHVTGPYPQLLMPTLPRNLRMIKEVRKGQA